jgi:hypothetical protein
VIDEKQRESDQNIVFVSDLCKSLPHDPISGCQITVGSAAAVRTVRGRTPFGEGIRIPDS